ncbi:MAG: adenylate/guanylate cyclase domain-containing protein [Planctomycetes bacterium]|nr:adenylate/guanylate cyclase domain-containing protein [Planctomycetota bacterium]
MSIVKYRYSSLEDFLISHSLSVDGVIDDGWGAELAVKGREIQAAILFADISAFTSRTITLSPAETLIFLNHFFTWIAAEAMRTGVGIVDKYIGDEIMMVFSEEFGSEDPFVDALQTARWMAEKDVFCFGPHIGIAYGHVIIGYVGTPLKYNCSAFGAPVVLAKRCAAVRPQAKGSASIIFPANLWNDRTLKEVLPPGTRERQDGTIEERRLPWELLPPRTVPMKNLPELEIREIDKLGTWFPDQSPEDRAREALENLRQAGAVRLEG